MKILFVQAISTENNHAEMVYPIGLVTLAGIVNKNHEVELLDLNIKQDPFSVLKAKIQLFQPEVVCISLRNIDPLGNKMTSLIPPFKVTLKMVMMLNPNISIIVGGTGFSLFPKTIMEQNPEIKYGIIGEAEESLLQLLDNLDNPGRIKGLCHRCGEDIIIEEPSRKWNMEKQYRIPKRDLLPPSLYTSNNYVQPIGIETKRGCPFTCSYCVYPDLQGRKVRCRNPEDVVDEIEKLYKEYDIKRIHFTDPVVNISSGHMEDICQQLIRRKIDIQWSGFFREDYIDNSNIYLFEDSGCECFSFSPDGLTQKGLDVLGKGMKIEQVKNAITLAADTQVITVYHYMVNVPGEDEQSVEESLEFIDWIYDTHEKNKNLGTIVFNNIRMYPGTPIYDYGLEKGVITPETNLLYPVYYNPDPYSSLRYQFEIKHLCRNVLMWQEMK